MTRGELMREFFSAVSWGKEIQVSILLNLTFAPASEPSFSVDINEIDPQRGMTALGMAAFLGHGRTLSTLIERGAEIEKTDAKGRTALHLAAEEGHAETIHLLLKAGADPFAANGDGKTPRGCMAHLVGFSGYDLTFDLLKDAEDKINQERIAKNSEQSAQERFTANIGRLDKLLKKPKSSGL